MIHHIGPLRPDRSPRQRAGVFAFLDSDHRADQIAVASGTPRDEFGHLSRQGQTQTPARATGSQLVIVASRGSSGLTRHLVGATTPLAHWQSSGFQTRVHEVRFLGGVQSERPDCARSTHSGK